MSRLLSSQDRVDLSSRCGPLGARRFYERFIDAEAGKVMDSWVLHMDMGEGADKEASMTGLDLLSFEKDKLVTKTTYRRG